MKAEVEKFFVICIWLAFYAIVAVNWTTGGFDLIVWTLFYAGLTRLVGKAMENG